MKYGSILGKTDNINNLKLVVNAAVNKLDIFARSSGATSDASNLIFVKIPDGNGNVYRSRGAAYLSGTSQFIMADAANYWSKGSRDAEIKTAYVYAIWDGTGIIWALGGYSGFTRCPASTTATDDDFFLLEASSTYTKAITDYCVCVGKIRYQYDTADNPDHTIQATVLDAPQVIWNPKSDYGYQKSMASTVSSGSDIAMGSLVAVTVKQSGYYMAMGQVYGANPAAGNSQLTVNILMNVVLVAYEAEAVSSMGFPLCAYGMGMKYLNAGEVIDLQASLSAVSGTREIYGDLAYRYTSLIFQRID